MAYNKQHPAFDLPPKALTYLLMAVGLVTIVVSILTQKLIIAAAVIFLPLALIILVYGSQAPRFGFLLYATYSYFFTAIMRYSRQEGLSVVLDILLVYMLITICIAFVRKNPGIKLTNAINILTVSYIAWMVFILVQLINPAIRSEGVTLAIRSWILGTFVLYVISSLLADNPRALKIGLIAFGTFTFIAFLKLLYQKYRWFDAAETEWLMNNSWYTHLLSSGIRYFSIFSDAGNFGAHMGIITIVYSIIGFHTRNRWLSLFFIGVSIMGAIGMLMSGTRGAIIIPFGGLVLYCFICKNIKIMLISIFTGIAMFAFFAFTDIGDSNAIIRRTRTAFRPAADESFNVRVENRRLIAEYLKNHPWGSGLERGVPRIVRTEEGELIREDSIPPDSYYVKIWMQTGVVGLILYVTICTLVLLRCCYLIMFRIKNRELMHTLAALLCGVFGVWLNGYVGEGMGQPPTNFVIVASLAFVLNGPYIDKQITQLKFSKTKP